MDELNAANKQCIMQVPNQFKICQVLVTCLTSFNLYLKLFEMFFKVDNLRVLSQFKTERTTKTGSVTDTQKAIKKNLVQKSNLDTLSFFNASTFWERPKQKNNLA